MEIKNLRPTWLNIDLDAIKFNLKQVRKRIDPDTEIMAIVKANGYGHGASEVSKVALEEGVGWLGVATVHEGVELRKGGIEAPILILGTLLSNQIDEVVEYGLTPTVYTYELAKNLSQLGIDIKVHIKVDTGMGRIGLIAEEAGEEIIKIANLPNIKIEGLFTHFAKSDVDEIYTSKQLDRFNRLISFLKDNGIEIPIIHTSNSAAIINFSKAHYKLVRMGIILYGLYPDPTLSDQIKLKPAMSWKAKIVHVKEVEAGTAISYGCTYITKSRTKVATLPVGYHDGYSRALSGQVEVLFKGKRVPVIGNICMDQMMIDVSGIEAEVGDVVTLIGREGEESISANELAQKLGTINYEVVSRIGLRVPRVFYKNNEVIGFKEG
ncbi:alanine racemase [Orenia metallireducens]|uniref:Alanine racemase n=1 Tax=Orenia metallireducens TaxID=1413210 RepID=A0A1C0ACU6_9FIRM|nr:alanine racemase [Orenia metallireducens]OCL28459.1 alanine racemase [Orenia metallireducens]